MSLVNWLSGTGPKPGLKRKLDDATESESESGPDKKKKPKEMAQKNFDWYKQDESGKWHCTICRVAKLDNAYAKGHDTPAKTTNHSRHSACKYGFLCRC